MFKKVFKENSIEVKGKSVLCVGARRGRKVRAFQDLGALAFGIDFNPGERKKNVLYGSASELQFASNVFALFSYHVYLGVRYVVFFFRVLLRNRAFADSIEYAFPVEIVLVRVVALYLADIYYTKMTSISQKKYQIMCFSISFARACATRKYLPGSSSAHACNFEKKSA